MKARTLPFMCLLAFSVGMVSGLGAWAFRMLIGLFHNVLFLGNFQFHYDANLHTPENPWGAGVILVPVIGALNCGLAGQNIRSGSQGARCSRGHGRNILPRF